MTPSIQKYLNLSRLLIQKRESGDLAEDEEEGILSQLDVLWYEMTKEEQGRIEKILDEEDNQ